MRIGIDASPLPLRPLGAGIYIIELLNSLSQMEVEDEILVYLQEDRMNLLDLSSECNIKIRLIAKKSIASRVLWEQIELPGLAKRDHLDVLHSMHYTRPLSLPCCSLVTLHDLTFFILPRLHTRIKRSYFRMMTRLSASKADALIAVSESTRRDAIRLLKIPMERIITIPLGVSEQFRKIENGELLDHAKKKYHLPEQFLLYVGTIEPRKNLISLLKAYEGLGGDAFPYDLVIVGPMGWMVRDVINRITNSPFKNRIHRIGYIDREDLPALYNLASVFVYPTLYEGFGLPLLEAMACGTPVVTSNTSSLPEIIGDAGLLVSALDVEAIREAIKAIVFDQEYHLKLSQAGRARAAHFSWLQTARKTYDLYRSVALQ